MSLSNDKESLLKVHLVEGETWMMKNRREKSEEKTNFMSEEKTNFMSVLMENWWSLCVLSPSPSKLYLSNLRKEIVVVNDWTTAFSFYMVDLDMLLPISYFLFSFFLCAFFLSFFFVVVVEKIVLYWIVDILFASFFFSFQAFPGQGHDSSLSLSLFSFSFFPLN